MGNNNRKRLIRCIYKQLVEGLEKISSRNIPIAYAFAQISNSLNINISDINEIFFKAIVDKKIIIDIFNKPLNISTLTISEVKLTIEPWHDSLINMKEAH